jgi:hypothetical protein
MNLKFFKEDFIEKWASNSNLPEREKKIQAGVNWLFTIHKQSFDRYEPMWKLLKEKCADCSTKNCERDYNELMSDITVVKSDNKGNLIKGLNDNEKLERYNKCKKGCYEKFELVNNILARRYRDWNKDLNHCFILCRAKPIDKISDLPNCYVTCMIDKSYHLADIEFYITYTLNKIIQEYDKNYIDNSKADLLHIYNTKERPLTPDLLRKYL